MDMFIAATIMIVGVGTLGFMLGLIIEAVETKTWTRSISIRMNFCGVILNLIGWIHSWQGSRPIDLFFSWASPIGLILCVGLIIRDYYKLHEGKK